MNSSSNFRLTEHLLIHSIMKGKLHLRFVQKLLYFATQHTPSGRNGKEPLVFFDYEIGKVPAKQPAVEVASENGGIIRGSRIGVLFTVLNPSLSLKKAKVIR